MASSLALKKLVSGNLVSGNLVSRSLRSLRSATPVASSRLFNTNVAARRYEDDDDDVDVDRRSGRPLYYRRDIPPFTDVFSPFSARSLSQILNMVDQLSDSDSPIASGLRRVAKETEDGVHIRLDMPGFGKEDVKVSVEQNTLLIKGESPQSSAEDEDCGRKVSSRIDLPEKSYKIDGIKAELKNGVLKVFVPKIKEEERTDVFHVKVE